MYTESDITKGFILAKTEFSKANSLFQYIYDHYYNRVIVSKLIPIPLSTVSFLLSLTKVLVKVCYLIEIIEGNMNGITEEIIVKKIVGLVKAMEELQKDAKKDK